MRGFNLLRFLPGPARYPGDERERRRRLRLHVLLFLATFASTFFVHAWPTGDIAAGLSYAVAIMGILGAHEMGHYLACRRYRVPATLPYFIPFPVSLFGTLGAVIRMGGPVYSRRALFDIAAAGPLAGLAVAIPTLVIGLHHSTVVPTAEGLEGLLVLGEPLLLQWLSAGILGPLQAGESIVLHPVAFAGWAGLFVTALNLIPAGQLDGGHVIYAMFGRGSGRVTVLVVVGLIGLSAATGFWGWLLFAALIAAFGSHPRTHEEGRPLERGRFLVGLVLLAVFVVCFTPNPIALE